MKKKFGLFTVLAAALLLVLPAISQAVPGNREGQGTPPCAGQNWQHPQIAPEKQAAYEKAMTTHREKAWSIKSDLSAKRMELEYLAQNPKTEPKTISALVEDIKNLRDKMHDLNKSTAASLQKELGISSDHAYALTRGGDCGPGQMWGGYHQGGPRHRR